MSKNLNPQQKKNLSQLLMALSTEDEKKELEQKAIVDNKEDDSKQSFNMLLEAFNKFASLSSKNAQRMHEAFGNIAKDIAGQFSEVGKTFSQSMDKNKAPDLSGFFKDFSTQLGQWADSSKKSEDLIRNLKWNASQQLRDVNGSPVNPSIAAFAITASYDDVQFTYTGSNLTQANYYQAGNLVATLVLTYDGSNNITEVHRTR